MTHITVLSIIFLSTTLHAANHIADSQVFWKNDQAQAVLLSKSPRSFKIKTSADLKDNLPAGKEKIIQASPKYPQVKSNSVLFDSIYALSINELIENSVERINDGAFNSSDCSCFETGRKWNYVWTRDISYSAHLALSALDQQRTLNSLLFKISNRRGEAPDSSEIVQDTGTGGSWPISSDRVVWAVAARELLKYLDGSQKDSFTQIAYTALKNTINNDRIALYDKNDGLYTGEQSFLDWREQTYPSWMKTNVTHIGMSKALSTNITHYMAIKTTAELALKLGDITASTRYSNWAASLKQSINHSFWNEAQGLYSTYLLTYLDQTKAHKFDLLGNAMAIIFNIAQTPRQKKALENYPMVMAGAPVITPQDPEAPIYHNRAIWPFVTQYALLAAQKGKQAKVYNHLFESMIRGVALNLSNMENFEFVSMSNWLDDGNLSGPVVNSQRQLWSVAGMLSTYLDGVFGKIVENNKIRFEPFITEKMRKTILKSSQKLSLKNFQFQNKNLNIHIDLPLIKSSSWNDYAHYTIKQINLNGTTLTKKQFIEIFQLKEQNDIEITLGQLEFSQEKMKMDQISDPYNLSKTDYEKHFSPKTPVLYPIQEFKGNPLLHFELVKKQTLEFNIYRNGEMIATNIKGNHFIDKTSSSIQTPCYVVEAIYPSNLNRSLHSEPHCFWRKDSIEIIPISQTTQNDSDSVIRHQVPNDGTYAIQLSYRNVGEINTGITAAVKKIKVINEDTGSIIAEKVFMMPHHKMEQYWNDSNFVELKLLANTNYQFELSDFYNMSYFEHFESYLYRGGQTGISNRAELKELKVLRIK